MCGIGEVIGSEQARLWGKYTGAEMLDLGPSSGTCPWGNSPNIPQTPRSRVWPGNLLPLFKKAPETAFPNPVTSTFQFGNQAVSKGATSETQTPSRVQASLPSVGSRKIVNRASRTSIIHLGTPARIPYVFTIQSPCFMMPFLAEPR